MEQADIFQEIFEHVRSNLYFPWFYSELKRHNIAHYIYYLATDNIRLITHDDNILLVRGSRGLVKVSTSKKPELIKEAARNLIGNDSNLLIVFYVQIMPDDFVMQLHRF
ncbi:DUF1398 family protein [Escherichia albertii]|nr:DUF1398 family protein [Escherichia albertii]